jgi:hypothetical protein
MIALWDGFRNKAPKLFRHIWEVRAAGAQFQNDRLRRQSLPSEVCDAGQLEVDFLAGEISSLARQIEDQRQQSTISVEEASLALHFRKKKQQIHRALVLLERQGNAKRISPEERWVLRQPK